MMPTLDTSDLKLYQRLQDYPLDDSTHEFGFTKHLIKNHGWTEDYAHRAIAEYKKFAFLTVVAKHQVVPSDSVDQVWHAHLLLTESYWSEFCPQILQKNLHHHPARGGKSERAEFHQLYRQTIDSYRQHFGTPPTDVWSPTEVRFGKELKMRRVSRTDNWIIPKQLPQVKPNIVVFSLILSLCSCITVFFADIVFASQKVAVSSSQNNLNLKLFLIPVIFNLLLQ
ncbi:MAG: TIGR04222 domain-containing membrane protein, partial [Cyanobacteria bacterium J06600_6]